MSGDPSPACRPRDYALLALGYLALAIVYTYPLIRDLSGVFPHDPLDPALNTWILWWNAQTVPLTTAWWNAPMMYPMPGSFAFSDQLLGISVFTTPLQWLGLHAHTTYNVALLLSFALSGLAAHLLAYSLTGRHDAAAIAGLSFGFSPYRAAQVAHLQVLSSYWMPVALLALHRYRATGRRRWLAIFAISWLLQSLCSGYHLFYFSILVVLWIVWFAWPAHTARHGGRALLDSEADPSSPSSARPPYTATATHRWKPLLTIGAVWVIAALPLLAVLLPMRAIHERHGLTRSINEIEMFSADLSAVLTASPLLAFWGRITMEPRAETQLLPGLTILGLTIAGLVVARRSSPMPRTPISRMRAALFAGALVLGLVSIGAAVTGGWEGTVLGVRLSVTRAYKPITLCVWLLAAAILTGPRTADLWRRRSVFLFYVLATGVLGILALGPSPRLFGQQVFYKAPYAWLLALPGIGGLRVPARIAMPATLGLSVAASLAFARLAPRDATRRRVLAAVVALAILGEGWYGTLPLAKRPPAIALLGKVPQGTPILEWPLGYVDRDVSAMYRTLDHGHPVVNGYSGYGPSFYAPLKLGFERADPSILDSLTRRMPLAVVVDYAADSEKRVRTIVEQHEGAALLGVEGDRGVYLLPRSAGGSPKPSGQRLPIARMFSSFEGQDRKALEDGVLTTRWDTKKPQNGDEFVALQLEGQHDVDGVVLTLGPFMSDGPVELVIETTLNGVTWEPAWSGGSAGAAYEAALEQPRQIPVTYTFASRPARGVRIRQTGRDAIYHWSIAELEILGE